MTPEEIKELDLLHIDARIKTLDTEYQADLDNRAEDITGSRSKIMNEVADRMRRNIDYERERTRLINQRNIIEGPSDAVAAYIDRKPPVSKFDVDAGRVKIEEDDPKTDNLKGKDLFPKKNLFG